MISFVIIRSSPNGAGGEGRGRGDQRGDQRRHVLEFGTIRRASKPKVLPIPIRGGTEREVLSAWKTKTRDIRLDFRSLSQPLSSRSPAENVGVLLRLFDRLRDTAKRASCARMHEGS